MADLLTAPVPESETQRLVGRDGIVYPYDDAGTVDLERGLHIKKILEDQRSRPVPFEFKRMRPVLVLVGRRSHSALTLYLDKTRHSGLEIILSVDCRLRSH